MLYAIARDILAATSTIIKLPHPPTHRPPTYKYTTYTKWTTIQGFVTTKRKVTHRIHRRHHYSIKVNTVAINEYI